MIDEVHVPASATLATLHAIVREHSTKRRRFPKWKFRLAPDLIVQIQPVLPKASARIKDNAVILSGLACMRDSVGLDAFLTREGSAACWSTGFQIKDWCLRHNMMGWRRATQETPQYLGRRTTGEEKQLFMEEWDAKKAAAMGPVNAMRDRIVAAFKDAFFERVQATSLLGHWCLIRGKPLTDPVSQGRFIGPECYSSASVNLPWIAVLPGMDAAA